MVRELESDFETTVDEDRRYVITHVVIKVIQANALLVPPVYSLIQLARRRPIVPARLFRATAIGTYGWGIPIGLLMGTGRLWNEPGYAIQDRAFRLRHSASQNHADRFSAMFGLGGALAFSALPVARLATVPFAVRAFGGSALGSDLGILAHLAVLEEEQGVKAVRKEVEGALPVKVAEDAVTKGK